MAQPGNYAPTVTIASGASLSGAAHIGFALSGGGSRGTLVGIQMPSAWTAASLTFQASNDGTTFTNLYDAAGNEVSVTTDASRWIALDPADFAGITHLKVRSGTSGTAVNQGADRVLTLIVRAVA
jgi:hypothetical protein